MLQSRPMSDQNKEINNNQSNNNQSSCKSKNCSSERNSDCKDSSYTDSKYTDPKCILSGFAKLMSEHGLTKVEYKDKNFEIELKRGGDTVSYAAPIHYSPAPAQYAPTQYAPAIAAASANAPTAGASSPTSSSSTSPTPAKNDKNIVKAELVGTAYLAASPNDPTYVKVGDKVEVGDTLLIIECMKTMNMVKAPRAGTVTEIYVTNGQPLEYDESLVCIE